MAQSPDFVPFARSEPSKPTNMFHLDSTEDRQSQLYSHIAIEPTLLHTFSLPNGLSVDNFHAYAPDHDISGVGPTYYGAQSLYESGSEYLPGLETASGPSIASASSSAIGSPYSAATNSLPESWIGTSNGLGLQGAMFPDFLPNEYLEKSFDTEGGLYQEKLPNSFVDPSMIHTAERHMIFPSPPALAFTEQSNYPLSEVAPASLRTSHPSAGGARATEHRHATDKAQVANLMVSSPSLEPLTAQLRPTAVSERRLSISSLQSGCSQLSSASSVEPDDEARKMKSRCSQCGRVFKDLKSHRLTHQDERPEKCPISTCEYHTKGFARKYDKNRHTLTHYKGTMVCGFCPGSGSPAEKSFSRADVFKRHLIKAHRVGDAAINSRKRTPTASIVSAIPTRHPPPANPVANVAGKCSMCSVIFFSAQDFYEHIDDCVLRMVQQEAPSEAINKLRLAEVAADEEVKKTMKKHRLLLETAAGPANQLDDDDEFDDDDTNDYDDYSLNNNNNNSHTTNNNISSRPNKQQPSRPLLKPKQQPNLVPTSSASKSRQGVSKRRSRRGDYPSSWACPRSSMKTKKRVLCVFDGQRRLWKDEMMLDNEFEVRIRLPGGAGDGTHRDAYVTDLDVETLNRAEGIFSANEEERGPWLLLEQQQATLERQGLMGSSAVVLPDLSQQHCGEGEELDLEQMMA